MKKRCLLLAVVSAFLLSACDSADSSRAVDNTTAATKTTFTLPAFTLPAPTTEEATLIPLAAPNNIVITQDGDTVIFDWPDVETATGYECTYEGAEKSFMATDSRFSLRNNLEGRSFVIRVRSIRETNKGIEYSQWARTEVSVASIDYESIRYGSAMFLGANQVVKWANTMGFECEKETRDDITTVMVHAKDSLNSGFFNSAGRILASAIEGFLGGYSETIKDDFSSVDGIIDKYVNSGSIKNLIDEEDVAATQNGKVGALKGALTAALLDTDIYYIYYYSDPAKSATMSTIYLLENNRENYRAETFGKYSKDNQGRYVVPFDYFNGNAYFEVTEVVSNGFKKWAVVGTHD